MHDVLAALMALLVTIQKANQIQSIQSGKASEVYLRLMNQDYPAIIVEPLGSNDSPSVVANCKKVTFRFMLWIVHCNRNPNDSRLIDSSIDNQLPVLSQIEENMKKLFSKNKNLGGVVRMWGQQWDVTDVDDTEQGNQIRKILTSWSHDLVPFDGPINNQSDTIRAKIN